MKTKDNKIDFENNDSSNLKVPVGITAAIDAELSTNPGKIGFDSTLDVFKYKGNSGIEELVSKSFLESSLAIDNLIKVKTNPQAGEFDSVKDAIDSITTNSSINRFIVIVYPGTYIEDTITMKPFVDLISTSHNSVIIEVDATNKDVINLAPNSIISDLILRGSTDAGKSIFKVASSFTPGQTSTIRNCTCGATDTIFKSALGLGEFAIVVFQNITISYNGTFNTGFDISGAGVTLVSLADTKMAINTAVIDFIHLRGAGNRVVLSDLGVIATAALGGSIDNFIRVYNGSTLDCLSIGVQGADTALYNENTGSGVLLRLNNFNAIESINFDVIIDHPSTSGNLSGTVSKDKISVDPTNATFSLAYAETGGGFVITGPFHFGDSSNSVFRANKLLQHAPTLGLMSGGGITFSSGLDVSIAAGDGYIHDVDGNTTFIEWSTIIVNIPTNSLKYIVVDESGSVVLQNTLPDNKDFIILGKVISNSSTIISINNTPLNSHHYSNLLDNFLRDVVKGIYVSGSVVVENATPLKINVGSGIYYFTNKKFTPTGGNAISFTTVYKSATPSQHIYTSGIDIIPVNNYDDGDGTLGAIPVGKFVKHRLYCNGSGVDEKYFLVYAQAYYDTLIEAEEASLPTPPEGFCEGVIIIAGIVVEQADTAITSIVDERPRFNRSSSGGGGGVTDHGDLTGLLNDDHLQYILTNGGRPYTGNQDFGGFQITNAGNINGVSITAHASRHLPNGADPLATTIPVDVGTSNAEGIANSFARSDHQHSHGNQLGGALHAAATGAGAGFMSATDKTFLDSLLANSKSFSVPDPVGSENHTLFRTHRQITITKIVSGVRGTLSPSVTFSLRYAADRSAVGTEVVTGGIVTTNTTTGLSTTVFNNAIIPAGNFVWLTTTAESGLTTEVHGTIEFNNQ